jgi:hypothetical protein
MIGFKFNCIIIVSFLWLSSCSQHIKVTPRKCLAPKARWSIPTDTYNFQIKHHIRTDGEPTSIRAIFKDYKKECRDLDHMQLTHRYTWGDAIWNLIPFTGRSTLLISGSSSASNTDN